MNRPLPRGDRGHQGPATGWTPGCGRAVPGSRGLGCGVADYRRLARTDALNEIQHGGFERKRIRLELREPVAPLETLCATSIRTEEMVGQCS